jgi:nitrate reductase cytochrome c-type subunit
MLRSHPTDFLREQEAGLVAFTQEANAPLREVTVRVRFDNNHCLHCHETTPEWVAVESHIEARADLTTNKTTCVECHGDPHPTTAQRTPGSSDCTR